MKDNLTFSDLERAYDRLKMAEARSVLWYVVSKHAPKGVVDDDGERVPGFYAIDDVGYWTVIVHPDKVGALKDEAAKQGIELREVNQGEWMRRARLRLNELRRGVANPAAYRGG